MPFPCYLIEPQFHGDASISGWINPTTGETHRYVHEFPPGAMWYATWIEKRLQDNPHNSKYWNLGPDGRVLIVKTPGGEWNIDSRASNCTKPDDDTHHCWCRHGIAPNITVDKVGETCEAGAGSIVAGNYHGFLRNGSLTDHC